MARGGACGLRAHQLLAWLLAVACVITLPLRLLRALPLLRVMARLLDAATHVLTSVPDASLPDASLLQVSVLEACLLEACLLLEALMLEALMREALMREATMRARVQPWSQAHQPAQHAPRLRRYDRRRQKRVDAHVPAIRRAAPRQPRAPVQAARLPEACEITGAHSGRAAPSRAAAFEYLPRVAQQSPREPHEGVDRLGAPRQQAAIARRRRKHDRLLSCRVRAMVEQAAHRKASPVEPTECAASGGDFLLGGGQVGVERLAKLGEQDCAAPAREQLRRGGLCRCPARIGGERSARRRRSAPMRQEQIAGGRVAEVAIVLNPCQVEDV